MLTSKQRAYLRSMANDMTPILQIGKGGIGEELTVTVDHALEARELIKITALETAPDHGFCYPAVHFLSGDEFLLSYCCGGAEDGTCLSRTRIARVRYMTEA